MPFTEELLEKQTQFIKASEDLRSAFKTCVEEMYTEKESVLLDEVEEYRITPEELKNLHLKHINLENKIAIGMIDSMQQQRKILELTNGRYQDIMKIDTLMQESDRGPYYKTPQSIKNVLKEIKNLLQSTNEALESGNQYLDI